MRKRSVSLGGHQTSISLEDSFWSALREIAGGRGVSVRALVAEVDAGRGAVSLSSALRQHALAVYRAAAASGRTGEG